MKNILLASFIALGLIGGAVSFADGADTIITNEKKQKQCFALCPGFGSDEYVECFKQKCAPLFDVEGEKNTSPDQEWKQISIVRSGKACAVPEGGHEQFYLIVTRTPSRDFGSNGQEAGILNAGDKFEIPEGGDWSVWLRGTKGTFVNLTGGTVMQIPCLGHEPRELMWDMISGTGLFDFGAPVEIQTRTAVAGVKGTQFILDTTEAQTHAYVMEGVVSLRNQSGAETLLNAQEWSTATAEGVSQAQQFTALPAHLQSLGKNKPIEMSTSTPPTASPESPKTSGGSWAFFIVLLGVGGYFLYRRKA